MMRYIRYAPLVLSLILAIIIGSGMFQPAPTTHLSPLVNRVMPEFLFPRLDNPQQSMMPRNWHGQVVLFNVFASWCEPCKAEHAMLMKLAQDRTVAIYGLAWKDKPDATIQWLHDNGNPYQEVGDDPTGKSTVMLGLSGAPETFVINKRNIVKYKLSGPLTDQVLREKILPLIDQLQHER